MSNEPKLNPSMAAACFAGTLRGIAVYEAISGDKRRAINIYKELIYTSTHYPYARYVSENIAEDKAALQKLHGECYEDCPECDGTGRSERSVCCSAEVSHGICLDCREHSEYEECSDCNGTGEVFIKTDAI